MLLSIPACCRYRSGWIFVSYRGYQLRSVERYGACCSVAAITFCSLRFLVLRPSSVLEINPCSKDPQRGRSQVPRWAVAHAKMKCQGRIAFTFASLIERELSLALHGVNAITTRTCDERM